MNKYYYESLTTHWIYHWRLLTTLFICVINVFLFFLFFSFFISIMFLSILTKKKLTQMVGISWRISIFVMLNIISVFRTPSFLELEITRFINMSYFDLSLYESDLQVLSPVHVHAFKTTNLNMLKRPKLATISIYYMIIRNSGLTGLRTSGVVKNMIYSNGALMT